MRFNRDTTITFENDTDKEHNFTVTAIFTDPDNFLSVDVRAKDSEQIRFKVSERPRDGFLSFYCKYHQSDGMAGRIKLV